MAYKPKILTSAEGGTGSSNIATSGKILIGDGTNFISSTPTYPTAAGTSGNFIVSNGTNFVSTAMGQLSYASVVLTSSQIKLLNSVPVAIIPAQGAGKVIILVSASYKYTYGGSNVFVAAAAQKIQLLYNTTPVIVTTLVTNAVIVSSASSYAQGTLILLAAQSAASLENQPVNAFNTVATEISGNAANDNTVTITCLYYVMSV